MVPSGFVEEGVISKLVSASDCQNFLKPSSVEPVVWLWMEVHCKILAMDTCSSAPVFVLRRGV